MSYDVCTGGIGSNGYNSTLISGPTYTNTSGGGDDSGGLGGINEEIDGTDPFGGPVLTDFLISYQPTFKYPENTTYAQDYPKLTEYLRNKMPLVKDMPTIVNAIQDITSLPISTIQDDLQWDNGPTIVIKQLDNIAPSGSLTVGMFDEISSDILFLDEDFVNQLENDNFDSELSNYFGLQENRDAFIFFLAVTILYEYVHYGDYLNGDYYPASGKIEEGDMFETRVYGSDVNSGTLHFLKKD